MLVVTRKVGEAIIREGSDTITISVESIHRGNARIGLDAPSHAQILRNELVQNREEFDVDSEAESENWDDE